jgi:hypothetical protein
MHGIKSFFNIILLFLLLLIICPAVEAAEETTLLVSKTAHGRSEKEYLWSVQKSVSPQILEMSRGESREVEYSVNVSRSGSQDKYWVEGEIILTNGSGSSEGLQIIEWVQYKEASGNYSNLAAIILMTLPEDQLKPYELRRIPYHLAFVPVEGATAYRTVSEVTITNYLDHMYERYGPELTTDFKLPPAQSIVNESINVDDSNGYSWVFNDSGSKSYKKSFSCDQEIEKHVSTATIRETGNSSTAVVTVICTSGIATTRSIDDWQKRPKDLANLLPVQLGVKLGKESITVRSLAQAKDILSMNTLGYPNNFVTTLYAQLLAAKLNLKNGTNASPIKTIIEEADAFIAENSYRSWKRLNKKQKNMLNYWVNQLDNYNNGNL